MVLGVNINGAVQNPICFTVSTWPFLQDAGVPERIKDEIFTTATCLWLQHHVTAAVPCYLLPQVVNLPPSHRWC